MKYSSLQKDAVCVMVPPHGPALVWVVAYWVVMVPLHGLSVASAVIIK